jgi:HD-GYP domain-containing protein (c-di-GMP phosphodiesterase class II)
MRLAELVSALSLGVDLGFGQPMEHLLRQCLIALRLADALELNEQMRAVVYYTGLLVGVGCHSDAHEQAKWFGDDIAFRASKYDHALGSLRGAVNVFARIGAGNPPLHRFRIGLEFLVSGRRDLEDMIANHTRLARAFAAQIGLPSEVVDAVGSAYEQWDGRGWPRGLAGLEIPLAARIASLAEYAEVAHRVGGVARVLEVAEARSGTQFEPRLVSVLRTHHESILAELDSIGAWNVVIDAEPALRAFLSESQIDAALLAIANFIDLKSPCLLGHAPAVAELAAAAAAQLGMSSADVSTARRTGLLHGFGRMGISNSILDKPGALGSGEWERVRMQPYITERMLHQSRALAPLGMIVVQHRERLDGSGYPRRLSGAALSRHGRLLAVAEAYQALRETRPYRPARAPDEAAVQLRTEVRAGRLDGDCVEAVLRVAGHRVKKRRVGPAGLTQREVEVLRLLARGLTTREIGTELGIAPKTAGNHIEHIYAKIGAVNRVTASHFAVQSGLLPDEELASEGAKNAPSSKN